MEIETALSYRSADESQLNQAFDLYGELFFEAQDFWGKKFQRQRDYLLRAIQTGEEKFQMNREAFFEFLASVVKERLQRAQPTIHLICLGGSGSHWVGEMLAECLECFCLGEVYLPPDFASHIASYPPAIQGIVFEFQETVFAALRGLSRDEISWQRFINTAHSMSKAPFYRSVRADTSLLYLSRDPRDIVMSTTFRKQEYREAIAPGATDNEYLKMRATPIAGNFARFQKDFELLSQVTSYEKMKADPARELVALCRSLGTTISDEYAQGVADRYDSARLLKKENDRRKGNLYDGEDRKTWKDLEDPRQIAMMHCMTAPAVSGEGYRLGVCFKLDTQSVESVSCQPDQLTGWARIDVCDESGSWKDLETSEPLSGSRRRLAIYKAVPPDQLKSLVSQLSLTEICAAGVRAFANQHLKKLYDCDLLGLDIASTRVSQLPKQLTWPSLQVINVSGLDLSDDELRPFQAAHKNARIICEY